MESPHLDGYAVDTLIGFGPTGQVWRGRAEPSGEPVAVKLLRPAVSLAATELSDRLRAEAVTINGLDSAHLVPVREIRTTHDRVVAVTDYVAGDSLDTLLARRDRLTPGEVITLVAPLAQAVADLHLAGLVHGNLTGSNLLIAPDGRPMLTDVGIALALGTANAQPADDVRALAVLGLAACPAAEAADDPVVRVLTEVAGSTAERRPSARDLARAMLAAGQAVPIRASGQSPRATTAGPTRIERPTTPSPRNLERPQAPPRRRLPVDRPEPIAARPGEQRITLRRVILAGATAGAVLIGTAAAYGHIRSGDSRAAASPTRTPPVTMGPRLDRGEAVVKTRKPASTSPAPTWKAIAQRLDSTRAEAFADAKPTLLDDVYAPGAVGLHADQATIRHLEQQGLHADGFTTVVVKVTVITTTHQSATLKVTDRLSAYQLVNADGAVAAMAKARPARSYLMTLAKTAAGWRVQSIEESAASSFG